MRIKILILVLLSMGLQAQKSDTLSLHLGLAYLFAADADYRDVYRDIVLMPRLDLTLSLSPSWSVWTAYSGLSQDGMGPVSGVPTKSAQHYISAGAAFNTALSESWSLRLASGPLLAIYREEAGLQKIEGNCLGLDLHTRLGWSISRLFSLGISSGYLFASASEEEEHFNLGGLWGGVGMTLHW